MIEHPEEEARLARRGAQRLGPEPGQRQEALEPLGLGGEEAQRRDGELGGGLLAGLGGGLAGVGIVRFFHRRSPYLGKLRPGPSGAAPRGAPRHGLISVPGAARLAACAPDAAIRPAMTASSGPQAGREDRNAQSSFGDFMGRRHGGRMLPDLQQRCARRRSPGSVRAHLARFRRQWDIVRSQCRHRHQPARAMGLRRAEHLAGARLVARPGRDPELRRHHGRSRCRQRPRRQPLDHLRHSAIGQGGGARGRAASSSAAIPATGRPIMVPARSRAPRRTTSSS